jgi:predicted DNA-binding WGR domain protein
MDAAMDMVRRMEFVLVDPARNRRRFYGLREQETLFGGVELVVTWGRLGQRKRQRSEAFASAAGLARRRGELIARRRRHGYAELP